MDICISAELSSETRAALSAVSDELNKFNKASYVEKGNHRIILKYIKNVNEHMMHSIKAALDEVCSKSVPFTVMCHDMEYLETKKKSQLVYTLRGNAGKLESLQQYIDNEMYIKGIKRTEHTDFPYIALSYLMPLKPLPTIDTPDDIIRIGQVHLLSITKRFGARNIKKLDTYPLTGGHLHIESLESDHAICHNEYGISAKVELDILPNHIAEGDVVKMVGSVYMIDTDKTRVRRANSRNRQQSIINQVHI